MPTGLDKFLAFFMPLLVVLFFGFLMYKNLKEPIDQFVGWIKDLIGKGRGKLPPSWEDGDIVYVPRERIYRR
jgi:fructose-specific phosphotransferase system IIC component